MQTAEEILREYNNHIHESDWRTIVAMRKYAEMHVQAALESAAEKGRLEDYRSSPWIDPEKRINKQSILNAYPLENIK